MVDADILGSESNAWTREYLLAGLLTHEDIECWKYGDDGPPAATPRVMSPTGIQAVKGWAVATPQPGGGFATHSVVYMTGDDVNRTWIVGEAVWAASLDDQSRAYAEMGSAEAATRRSTDALAACVAQQIKADLFVTDRAYLHEVSGKALGRGVTYCQPAEALALVSLYLRAQGRFLIWKDPHGGSSATFNKGLFYWVGARELLPAAWRWFGACVQHAHSLGTAQGPDELVYLGGAVLQRVTRVLQARDDLLRAVNRHQDNDVAEDALIALDTCLIFLMGAVDATARVAHRVLNLPPARNYRAKWQNSNWLAAVSGRVPDLAELVSVGAPGCDALTILRLLRNSVHETGLTAMGIGLPGRREGTLVGLPTNEREQILAAADRLGGRSEWGLRELLPGRLHAEPDILLERLLPAIVQLLNDLMTATPVENLSGVSLTAAMHAPPRDANSPFGERERLSIRWQLGF